MTGKSVIVFNQTVMVSRFVKEAAIRYLSASKKSLIVVPIYRDQNIYFTVPQTDTGGQVE